MAFKKGEIGNPNGRPTVPYVAQLREFIGKDAQRYIEFIKKIIDGEKVVVGKDKKGKDVKEILPLDKRVDYALKLLNKVLPDVKAVEHSGDIGLQVTHIISNIPAIEAPGAVPVDVINNKEITEK